MQKLKHIIRKELQNDNRKKVRRPWRRFIAVTLCLSMAVSLLGGLEFFVSDEVMTAKAAAGSATTEYDSETLEYMLDHKDEDAYISYWVASRPYYTCAGSAANSTFTTFGGVEKRTIFHVYAFEGETICIGSSVYNSGLDETHKLKTGLSAVSGADGYKNTTHYPDKDSVDIVMTDQNGKVSAIDIRNSQAEDETTPNMTGYIGTPDMEKAAIKLKKENGKFVGTYNEATYTPYTYTVTETGIYTFEFHSYDKDGTANPSGAYGRDAQWPTADTNYINGSGNDTGGMIAALNLTVFDESGIKQTGRAYADFLSLQMQPTKDGIEDSYYILTTDSYIYKMKFNGASPYTYNFFSNNRGILDSATGNILYKSVKDIDNGNSFERMGITYKYPGTKDTDLDRSFYIFLEYPDNALEGHLFDKPVQPDPATNIRFVDKIIDPVTNKEIPGSYVGAGGYFAFDVQEATTATLRLEFKTKTAGASGGIAPPADQPDYQYAPVEISNVVTPHATNYFYWDGKDGNGVVIPVGTYDINDLVYVVTTKAGEIHFPIFDMENAKKGVTFTRLSHIYNKAGEQVDTPDNIYGLTKSVVYYDETAIYYGERAASTGYSENQETNSKTFFEDSNNKGKYYDKYLNMSASGGGEYAARQSEYIKGNPQIRVGDHSHINNKIQYFEDATGEVLSRITNDQKQMIAYLNSETYPVGKAQDSKTTTDYAIANFWAFIPSAPARSDEVNTNQITIIDPEKDIFSLIGRVFYDGDKNKTYNPMSTGGDHLLSGVPIKLYKKLEAGETSAKETIEYNGQQYEFISFGETSIGGTYTFSGLKYDAVNGTTYLYQVSKPDPSYEITTEQAGPNLKNSNGQYYSFYANYAYDTKGLGTETQIIQVGGSDGVDPKKNKMSNSNMTVAAIDIGYYYTLHSHTLTMRKLWNTTTPPEAVVFELSYLLSDTTNTKGVYALHTLSNINAWQYEDEYPPAKINNNTVKSYYISAEYYIVGNTIYKQEFDFDPISGQYQSFEGICYSYQLDGLPGGKTYNLSNLPDINGDGRQDINDLAAIKDWKAETTSQYKAVLDYDERSENTTATIANSKNQGTVEIIKYHDELYDTHENIIDENLLSGATFRVYEGTIAEIQALINAYNTAVAEGNQDEINRTYAAVLDKQVASSTTRVNGRVAFPNLDPVKTYTVREVFPPSGYRILDEYYQVVPATATETGMNIYKFNENGYVLVPVGNVLAGDELVIRKRIAGRAWQDKDSSAGIAKDSFSFTVAYKETDIQIDVNEPNIFGSGTTVDILKEEFTEAFDKSPERKQTVDYDSDYYVEKDAVSPDTKISKGLLAKGGAKTSGGETIFENGSFCGVEFKAAGTYSFTITEDDINIMGDTTLEKSPLAYTVNIKVTRVVNDPSETEVKQENSHLEAEVSDIISNNEKTGVTQRFAGNSPIFTNTYIPAPVQQSTTYEIKKNFAGRTGSETWLNSDQFDVVISSIDDNTKEALANRNLVIGGLNPDIVGDDLQYDDSGVWTYTFNKENHDMGLKFGSFSFKNISFPVEYVNNEDPTDIKTTISEEEKEKYTARTQPVVYKLQIQETIPTDTNGITYDKKVYTLTITLRNTEKTPGSGQTVVEEEDGVIDEIDLLLTNNIDSDQATCMTTQKTLEEKEWLAYSLGTNETKWYLTKSGETKEYKSGDSVPAGETVELYIIKKEEHSGEHIMTFINTYSLTAANWTPQVKKQLAGREWVSDDKFTFTLEQDSVDPVKVLDPEQAVTITNGTVGYTQPFKSIEFTVPGIYHFTITEEDPGNNIKQGFGSYPITIVAEDDEKGGLTLTRYHGTYTEEQIGNPSVSKEELASDTITFINTYSDIAKSFALNIQKTLKGRVWLDTDEFLFTIKPDNTTKAAIDDKAIIISDTLKGDSYLYTLNKNISVGTDPTQTGKFGDIQIVRYEEDQYRFTITETVPTGMECDHNSIDLFINVKRELNSGSTVPTGDLIVTYAFAGSGSDEPISADGVTVQFTNTVYTDVQTLSIEKQLVGRDWNSSETFTANLSMTEKPADAGTVYIAESAGASPAAFDNPIKIEFSDETVHTYSLKFPGEGTYTFTVQEEKPASGADEDLYYDEQLYTVTYYVAYDEINKKFVIAKTVTPTVEGSAVDPDVILTNVATGTMTIGKTVEGSSPDSSKRFGFTITLEPQAGSKIKWDADGKYLINAAEIPLTVTPAATGPVITWTVDSTKGTLTGTFTLAHNEQISIDNLPAQVTAAVAETERIGYNLEQIEVGSGTVSAGFTRSGDSVSGKVAVGRNPTIQFINAKAPTIPGTGGNGWPYMLACGLEFLIMLPIVYFTFRRRRRPA